MNRFPQESHSPTRFPSAPVENRRGAPHLRQGRPRGTSESNRAGRSGRPGRSGRSSGTRSSLGAARCGTKTEVVSQSAHTTSMDPPLPSRNARGAPHTSHSGPLSSPWPSVGAVSDGVAEPEEGDGRREETPAPSTNANSFAQEGHVPVRRSTSRRSNSMEVPQSGQELVMFARRTKTLTPHYIDPWLAALECGRTRGPVTSAGDRVRIVVRERRSTSPVPHLHGPAESRYARRGIATRGPR